MELCDYGCGQEAKFFFKNGKKCCSRNHKSCPSLKNVGIPDPKTNIANIKVNCKYCNKRIGYSGIRKHQETCYLNPINLRLCPVCNKPIKKKENKYCSSSCSAKINNSNRTHSDETKRKISMSLGGEGILTKEKLCLLCNEKTINNRLYCNKCLPIILGQNSNYEKASLSWTHYEERLSQILEQFYGKLSKEKINGVFPDFCNEKYIIDFTFDHTKGTSDLINRFKSIKNDNREKIAFIPDEGVGDLRRKKLIELGVEIKSSDSFRYLMTV